MWKPKRFWALFMIPNWSNFTCTNSTSVIHVVLSHTLTFPTLQQRGAISGSYTNLAAAALLFETPVGATQRPSRCCHSNQLKKKQPDLMLIWFDREECVCVCACVWEAFFFYYWEYILSCVCMFSVCFSVHACLCLYVKLINSSMCRCYAS